MKSQIFERVIHAHTLRNSEDLASVVAQVSELLNRDLARYMAENLPDNAYQLLKVTREVRELPSRGHAVRLTLDVGTVTERPFFHVATYGELPTIPTRADFEREHGKDTRKPIEPHVGRHILPIPAGTKS